MHNTVRRERSRSPCPCPLVCFCSQISGAVAVAIARPLKAPEAAVEKHWEAESALGRPADGERGGPPLWSIVSLSLSLLCRHHR